MSSAWISTSGSPVGWPAMNSVNDTLPVAGGPPRAIVTAAARPLAANGGCALGHSSASTMASFGWTRSIMAVTRSGAIIGFSGAATSPALAMPILASRASTEFSQNSSTTSPRDSPRASSACAT